MLKSLKRKTRVLISLDPKMKAVERFAATAFLLYILWFCFYEFYLVKQAVFLNDLIEVETNLSSKILSIMPVKDNFEAVGNRIFCNGTRLLRVGDECSGLVLFVLFSGFIICYPGSWKHKLWFIPLGVLLIFFINLLRMAILSINFKYFHSSFAFNHHVTFTYTVYLFIFLLWIVWVNKFGNVRSNPSVKNK